MAIDGAAIGDYARQFIGTPYVWGGNNLNSGIDCSGLTQQVFRHFGIELPRVTYDQIGEGSPVAANGLRAGDLVFFDTDRSRGGPDHVGIYIGNGKMIHAPRPGKGVEITDMTGGYYMDRFMGGRRVDGVRATGSRQSDFAETPSLTPEELAASYGWAYGFLNSNRELKNLFEQAVEGTWTEEKFQAELRDTNWWNENSATRREAQVTRTTDPATWNAQMNATQIQIQQLAAEIGAAIPSSRLSSIARNALETGIAGDEEMLRNAIGQYVDFTKNGTLRGEAGMHEYTMREFAYNNGIELSDRAIKNQAQLVVRRLATTEDFQNQIRQQAISMYPGFRQQIEAGQTVRDIATPYIQMMSDELEIPSATIDVVNPLIKEALNGMDRDGNPSGISLTDFQTRLRGDPRWSRTTNAMNNAQGAASRVLQDFGLISAPED